MRCSRCEEDKAEDMFHKTPGNARGRAYACKACIALWRNERNKELYPQQREMILAGKARRRKKGGTTSGMLATTVSRIRSRCAKSDIMFNLRVPYLSGLIEAQKWKCAISGQELKLKDGGPQTASIDRIKPELGYVIGNVRWVTWQVNAAMGAWGEETLFQMCQDILSVRGEGQ